MTCKRSPGYVESILEINNLILIDTGEYWCYAENALGLAKEKFTLKVDELVPCSDEDKDYCLNGGQCYTYKNERVSFQCSCYTPYFGSKCERVAVDLNEYKFLEVVLSQRTKLLVIFGALFVFSTILLGKTSHPVNHSNHGSRVNSTVKDSAEPILINDFHTRDRKIENIPVADDYFGQTGGSYILSAPNLVNTECYENRSQNFTGDVMIDLKSPLSTSHVNPQQLHDHSRNTIQFGYRPSSSLDQCNESVHKPENGITLNNRPFGTDWSTRRLASKTSGSIRDRLPVLAEGSNLDLNVNRYPDYTDPIDRMNRFDRDREIPLNMISSSSSFMQTNT
ncbi:hypothetical protein Smp_136660 [Schistosoma mansoni]|uniref:hypothetical protein n=1 Tax=Schistosoma mansoni TaxID=6183 RepID=UPI0001A64196|nr:hypothetical protein Smp_136660 [Schistosoma mansoni]|eukprot:XP_018653354.1 hypothetical protein Smp_136660 [Schistosoma mansoni]